LQQNKTPKMNMNIFSIRTFLLAASLSSTAKAFTILPPATQPKALSRSSSTIETSSTSLFLRRNGRPRGPVRTIEVKPPMNDEINYDTLRVTVPNLNPTNGRQQKDEPLGIMSKADAIAKAKELGGLDVILINENSDPPVAKIVNYSKFRYEKEKKAKELKKNSKATEIKEVKMSYKIDKHDYGVRVKNASKFIKQGNRVKCTVMFKGREVQHDNLGHDLLNKMAEEMNKICVMEGKPKREGRMLGCILSPRPEVTKAVNDKKRADEKAKKKSKKQQKEAAKMKKEDTVGVVAGPGPKKDDDEDVGSLDDLLGDGDDDLFN
jgi:translation initiation factor IF-3